MKQLITTAIMCAIGSHAFAVNCEKNPSHRDCGAEPPPSDGAPRYIVKNGDGTVIGDAFDIHWEGGTTSAQVRLVHNDGAIDHGFTLRFFPTVVSRGVNGYLGDGVWDAPGCTGAPDYISNLDTQPGEQIKPFMSDTFRIIQYHDSNNSLLAPALARLSTQRVNVNSPYRFLGPTH